METIRQRTEQAESATTEHNDTDLVTLKHELSTLEQRNEQIWNLNCQQLREFDKAMGEKEDIIHELQSRMQLNSQSPPRSKSAIPLLLDDQSVLPLGGNEGFQHFLHSPILVKRRGRAPPIDLFTGDDEAQFDDWLPASRGHLSGTSGPKRNSSFSSLAIFEEGPFKSGNSCL